MGAVAGVGALALAALVGGPASAALPDGLVSLEGSNFEIDEDANLKVDNTGWDDWGSVTETYKADTASGTGDDSFGQGSKEDTPVPTVVSGSIPPNKSDLKTFGIYLEEATTADGHDYLHMFWHRVQDPTGTTNMDFEFNQKKATSDFGNGITPERTAGDLLIQYDLANGGTHPELFLSLWVATGDKSLCEAANSTPCWGDRVNLTTSLLATGSINTSAILSADSDVIGADISPRTFGEATVDFTAITGGDCVAFGSAYLKSRSSDSFTAAMKDFIAPLDTGINNCGALVISKTMKHAASGTGDWPQEGVDFTVTGGSLPADGQVVTTDANGEACIAGLESGDYTVTESVPDNYAVTSDNPQTATVVEDTDCDSDPTVTFTNVPLTDITVSVDSLVDGGTFSSIECDATVEDPDTDPDVSLSDQLDDPSVTVNDLQPGTYTCVVVIDP
ncbi:prealbumin-like fold domain-containing protein [Agromyces bauzanensis]